MHTQSCMINARHDHSADLLGSCLYRCVCLCSEDCQRQNAALRMEGAGRGHGEPPEQLWSVIGEHGKTTQYMSRTNRLGRLERVLQSYSEQQGTKLAALLVRMLLRARLAATEAKLRARQLATKLRQRHLNVAQVRSMRKADCPQHGVLLGLGCLCWASAWHPTCCL